jgi:isopropylmalate/homocitrate/citramalate synthase
MFHRRCRGVEPLEYLPFAPEMVGRPGVDIALGKGSGLANIEEHLERRGLSATVEQQNEMLARVKQLSIDKKALLTAGEFDGIAEAVLGRKAGA